MNGLYKSKYYLDLQHFIKRGWTEAQINAYFPVLEAMSQRELFDLHAKCGVKMFSRPDDVDEESAIHVLVSGSDVSKPRLIEELSHYIKGDR
jgi:hypothetical protein